MSDHDQLPLYALGALPADERSAFEAHLAACERCQDELASYDPAVDAMATLATAAPPPDLRDRVLAEIRRVPAEPAEGQMDGDRQASDGSRSVAGGQATGRSQPADGSPSETRPQSEGRTQSGGRPHSGDRRPLAGGRSWQPQTFALAAGIVLFAVVAVAALGMWRRADVLDTRVAELRQAVAGVDEAVAVLAASDARVLDTSSDLDGGINVITADSLGQVVIVGDDLQSAPDGRVYQAWLVEDAQPQGAGLITSTNGVLAVIADADDADAVALTIEPPEGSPAPTGPTVVRATLD